MNYPMLKKQKKATNERRRDAFKVAARGDDYGTIIKLPNLGKKNHFLYLIPLPKLEKYPCLGYLNTLDKSIKDYPEIAEQLKFIKIVRDNGIESDKYALLQFCLTMKASSDEYFISLKLRPLGEEPPESVKAFIDQLIC